MLGLLECLVKNKNAIYHWKSKPRLVGTSKHSTTLQRASELAKDIIQIAGLEINAIVGILEAERVREQKILLDLRIHTDIRPAARSKMIEDAVDYSFLAKEAERIIRNGKYLLLETLAEDVCDYCLQQPRVSSVDLSVKKPEALSKAEFVGVRIHRSN